MDENILDRFSKTLLQNPKRILGENGEIIEIYDQLERSKREDSIPEWGANAPLNYDAWVKRCGALNSQETD
jgi:endonuclease YncB( thermonuclease family)